MRTKQSYINERDELFESYLDTIRRIDFWSGERGRLTYRHRKGLQEELAACRDSISERLITLDNIITGTHKTVDVPTQLLEVS